MSIARAIFGNPITTIALLVIIGIPAIGGAVYGAPQRDASEPAIFPDVPAPETKRELFLEFADCVRSGLRNDPSISDVSIARGCNLENGSAYIAACASDYEKKVSRDRTQIDQFNFNYGLQICSSKLIGLTACLREEVAGHLDVQGDPNVNHCVQ